MCANNHNHPDTQHLTTFDAQSSLSYRFNNLTPWNILDQIRIRTGTMADYHALSRFHYRSARPGAPTRILVMELSTPQSHIQRAQTQPAQQHSTLTYLPHVTTSTAYRALHDPTNTSATKTRVQSIVGVLVESLPALSCSLRDYALDRRYSAPLTLRQRAKLLNSEMRCISRVVIHPQYRGLSLAVTLVKHALSTATTQFTESLAAMGQVNPFFQRAGMTPYIRPEHPHDARLSSALETLQITQTDLVRVHHAAQLIHSLPSAQKRWITAELTRWHRHYNRAHKPATTSDTQSRTDQQLIDILDAARKRLYFKPMYYLHINHSEQKHQPQQPTADTQLTPTPNAGYPTAGTDCGTRVNAYA